MRALTGFDRAVLVLGDTRIESSRSRLAPLEVSDALPPIVGDSSGVPIGLFPRKTDEPIEGALLRSPSLKQLEELKSAGISSTLRVPIVRGGSELGHFQCENRSVRPPSFEVHAAAELFAQIFGMLLRD